MQGATGIWLRILSRPLAPLQLNCAHAYRLEGAAQLGVSLGSRLERSAPWLGFQVIGG
jgi:hypothetical protein